MLLADSPSQQLSTPTTPTDIFRPNARQLPAPGTENGNVDQMNTEQPAQVSIRDRMAAANERGDTESTNRTSAWNPLDKYTNSDMDPVHLGHPMAALKNIDLDTIGSWEQIPGVKLLAQPFGAYANKIENHNALKALIFAAVIEITNADKVSICAPRRSPTANRNPSSFLIHNLSEKQKQTLLLRGVWSSTNITFRVLPIEPECPNYLFSIKGLTTQDCSVVYDAIEKVWGDPTTKPS